MALQNFVNFVGPAISAAWLNAVDVIKTTILGDAATKADARTALTSDAPLEVVNGGTGVRSIPDLVDLIGGDISLPSQTGLAYGRLFTDGTNAAWEKSNVLHVNDFGAVADGGSHPLSDRFSTLGDAQAVYPHATALTDEIDWCAWQAAANLVRTRTDYGYTNKNWGVGKIIADGRYVVNKSIQFSVCSVIIEGLNCGERYVFGGATSITYNGPDGTDADKIAIFDFFPIDETGTAPPGLFAVHGQGVFKCYHMGFFGKGAGDSANLAQPPSVTGYIWGIRLRNGSFCEISKCTFGGGLLDAIVAASQLFLKVNYNFFYGVHRDCVSILGFLNDFSTTCWIEDNEFGYFGRYAILQNYNGAIEPMPSIRRNSCESGGTQYYGLHPEWYVQGVVAPFCQIGGTYGQYSENRFEGIVVTVAACIHLIAVGSIRLSNNRASSTVLSSYRDNPNRVTSDYTTFVNAHKYVDITDTRNFHAPTPGDFLNSSLCGSFTADLISGYTYELGGCGLSSTGGSNHHISNGTLFLLNLPVDTSGAYYKAYPVDTAVVTTKATTLRAHLTNVLYINHPIHGPVVCHYLDTKTGTGSIEVFPASSFGTWTQSTAYKAAIPPVTPTTSKWVLPTTYNGYVYECTVAGTSDVTEPVWPTTIGNTVTDGGVTWTCAFHLHLAAGSGLGETLLNDVRTAFGDAAPTTGRWSMGDKVVYRLVQDGRQSGWTCIASGIPGTWAPYGYVAETAPTSMALTDTVSILQSTTAKKATMQKIKDVVYLKPINSQSGNYVLVALDSGQSVLHPSGAGAGHTFTIPSNSSVSYPVGTELEIINEDSNALSIAINTNTMTLEGSTTTGTRTLAQNGRARAKKTSTTTWLITGTGLT